MEVVLYGETIYLGGSQGTVQEASLQLAGECV
jgi:hypothetical protein